MLRFNAVTVSRTSNLTVYAYDSIAINETDSKPIIK